MTELAKELMEKASNTRHKFLRAEQKEDLENELKAEDERIKHAEYFKVTTTNIGEAYQNKKRIQARLQKEGVPDIDPVTKDIIAKEIDVLEGEIRHGMPTREAMRRNEVGAVHHHSTWERYNKPNILKWKNLKSVLENDSEDPDLCNVERLRPTLVSRGGTSTFAADAQISGHSALSESAKENVPEFMDKVVETSALGQITRTTSTGRDVKQPAYEARECECGCGNLYTPKKANARFATPTCRSRFHSRKQAKKKSDALKENKVLEV